MKHRLFLASSLLVFMVSSATFSMADLSEDLVGYWPLDGDADDSVGDHNGILVGGASFVEDAKRGTVLSVDGTDDHIEVPHAADMVFSTSDSYTLSAWVYLEGLPGSWQTVMAKSRDQGTHYGFWITDGGDWMGGGWENRGSKAVTQVWVHVAYVQDGAASTGTTYINGEVDWSGGPRDGTGLGDFWIGGAKSVTEFLGGFIDDVAVYNRVLPPDEVQQLANGVGIFAAVEPRAKLTTTWGSIREE
jgi:hypothetical protein